MIGAWIIMSLKTNEWIDFRKPCLFKGPRKKYKYDPSYPHQTHYVGVGKLRVKVAPNGNPAIIAL